MYYEKFNYTQSKHNCILQIKPAFYVQNKDVFGLCILAFHVIL